MPDKTVNYELSVYDRDSDKNELFINYRDSMAGSGSTSNINIIDRTMKANEDAIVLLDEKTSNPTNKQSTTQQPITSFDSDTKDAKVLYEIEGQTVVNVLGRDGDFSNGNAFDGGSGGTTTIENGELVVTSDGTRSDYFYVQRTIYTPVEKPSTYYFVHGEMNIINNENVTRARISPSLANAFFDLSTRITKNANITKLNQWQKIGSKFKARSDMDVSAYMAIANISDSTTNAKFKVKNIISVEITEDEYNNLTVDQLITKYPYVNGTSHSTVDLQTEGKNLFDGEWDTTNTGLSVTQIKNGYSLEALNSAGVNVINVLPNISFKENTQYTFTGFVAENDDTKNVRIKALYASGAIQDIFIPSVSNTAFTTVSAINETIEAIVFSYSYGGGITNLTFFQIEKGTTSTPYQPYKSKTLQPNITLRSLPTVSDKLRNAVLVDGKLKALECAEHVKNVSDDFVLDGSENWGDVIDNMTNTYYSYLYGWATENNVKVPQTDFLERNNDTPYAVDATSINTSDERRITFSQSNGSIYVRVEKTKIDSMEGASLKEKFKNYLNQHPVTLNLQLATPTITKLPNQPELWSYKDGRLIDNSTIKPKITYSLAQNLTAQSQSNTEVLQKHEEHLKRLDNTENEVLKNINQQTKTLTNSNPTEHIIAKQNCGVDVEVGGSMVVNVLGRDGDFSNGNAFNGGHGRTTTIENGELVVTSDGTRSDYFYVERKVYTPVEKPSTYYFVHGEMNIINNENVTRARISPSLANAFFDLSTRITKNANITKLNQWQKIGSKFKARSDMDVSAYMAIANISDSTTNAQFKVRNIISVEITEDEYNNLTVDQLLDKYPYTNSAQPLLNPAVEVCGKNLLPDSEGWGANEIHQYVALNVKSNISYTINNINSNSKEMHIYDGEAGDLSSLLAGVSANTSSTFVPSSNRITIYFIDSTDYNELRQMLENSQLEQGETATPYQPYKGGQIIFPTELAKLDTYQDKLTYKDGVAKVDRKVKHVVLDGSLESILFSNYTGGKGITFPATQFVGVPNIGASNFLNKFIVSKYDGSILTKTADNAYNINNSAFMDINNLLLFISDTDSGWGENYIPNANDTKAYFNGWQMNNGTFGIPYNNSGTPTWIPLGDTDNTRAVTTVPTTVSPTIEDGTINHYQLYYALAEPIQEEIQPIILGDGVNLVEGQNTLTVKSGMVWEKVKPVYSSKYIAYYINAYGSADIPDGSELKYKNNTLQKIIKKKGDIETDDTSNWETVYTYAWGNERYKNELTFDTEAEYWMLYKVLQEDYNCQVQQAKVSYEDNIRGALSEAVETIANLQSDFTQYQYETDAHLLELEVRLSALE